METRRRRAQTRRAVLETSRTRLQKSWNKSPETFLPAFQRAKAANISACARCRACPRDEQISPPRVLQQCSTPAEGLRYRDLEYLRARNADLRPHAFQSVHPEAPVAERNAPVR